MLLVMVVADGRSSMGSNGGREEIRTPEGFDPLRAFQARALDHYATLPGLGLLPNRALF